MNVSTQRIFSLDFLRGLAASAIMVYHYLSWANKHVLYDSSTSLGRIGIYGVSIFYILSGLTLYHVYALKHRFDFKFFFDFWTKRIFRIFPLLWLSIILTLVLNRTFPDFGILFNNLTGLFGFISWDEYIAVGSWSIGNELVFYFFFPFLLAFASRNKFLFYFINLLLLVAFLWMCFLVLDPSRTLREQWSFYVNPLNQAFLFCSGVLLGYSTVKIRLNNIHLPLLLFSLSLCLFILYPIQGDQIQIATGFNRILFSLLCILMCFSVYKLNFANSFFCKPLFSIVGEISYSVYLLHPLVYLFYSILQYKIGFGDSLKIILAIPTTLVLSYFMYNFFEVYFIRLGRSLLEHKLILNTRSNNK